MSKLKNRANALQKRQLRAFAAGQESARDKVIEALENRYRFALTARVWLLGYVAWGLGLAMGAALYEAWLQAGF